MRFPPHILDDIRARLPISQVVGRRVAWDKRKSNPGRGDFWACCPFHGEKTPSFHAEDRKGRYHCFGCGVSGDHFTFLVEKEGVSFPEAVEQLAAEAGIALPARDADAERREESRASLHDVLEKAALFFEAALQGPEGGKARAYLRERGLPPDVQKRFRIGYAPASRNALKEHLAGAGITQEQMIEAGLLIAGDDIPVSFDRFRDRVMFPIADLRGRSIAFGGRALAPDAQAKYLNSPETPLFHKGRVLYNGQAARAAARTGGHVVAVEGYVDVIACVTAGFEATVAPLGTALTEDQLHLLWQMADEPILCFDGDAAGLKAAVRSAEIALSHLRPGKSLKIALLPEGKDPDDLIRGGGAEAFEKVLEAALPLSQFIVWQEVESVDLKKPEQRAALERTLYDRASQIADTSVARHYRDFFRLRLSELFWNSDGSRSKKHRQTSLMRKLPANSIEKIVVGFCVEEPTLYRDFIEEINSIEFRSARYMRFFRSLFKLLIDLDQVTVNEVYHLLGDEFFDVLSETHGVPRHVVISFSDRKRGPPIASGGERLRLLFPAIKLQPSFDELGQTLRHLILLHRQKVYEEEVAANVRLSDDENAWDAKIRALHDIRTLVQESEKELDILYQRLRFRPTGEMSLGQAVLGSERRPLKEALRLVR